MIKFYKTFEPYGYLNNFFISRMFIYSHWWDNVESAYQSRKSADPEDQNLIWETKRPREARDLGQKIKIRPDWESVKEQVMYECILAKFVQNHNIRKELLLTYPHELVENSPIDSFWGSGIDGNGKNMLGKILMKVRSDLQEI